jgi:C1A family cysteine protease
MAKRAQPRKGANRQKTANDGSPDQWPFYDDRGAPHPAAAQALQQRRMVPVGDDRAGQHALHIASSALNLLNVNDGRPVVALGWHPDLPDFRDKTSSDKSAQQSLERAARSYRQLAGANAPRALPRKHENLQWCPPIEDQGALGSCTAQAVVGLIEFMQRRVGQHVDGSRLFTYKVTRKLLGWSGDTGAYLRTAMKSVAAFGVPPEEYWPYDVAKYEEEPSAFLYSFAASYKALEYTRIDVPGAAPKATLEEIKRVVASGLGIVFGFSVYSSISNLPDIPVPRPRDRLEGGHAVMIVGYDDDHRLPNGKACPSLIIRNSWGVNWGAKGYGYLPYEYVLRNLADDFWTVLKSDWLELKVFD